jgi:hypothetical protein
MNKENFAKGVERLINPISVGGLHFIQPFNALLPKTIQRLLVKASAKKTPHMGFVVEPYSLFLCYEIIDLEKAQSLLPDGFKLIKTKVFFDDMPKYYCIFGNIRAHTSAFWGIRTEFYVIAEDTKTGLLSWIIISYDTDTISYDSKNGLTAPNANRSVLTINHRGRLFLDIQRDDQSRKLILEADIEKGEMRCLDQRLWLEGNLSIGYGKDLAEKDGDIFSLRFEPCEVEKALYIPAEALDIETNTWFPGLFADKPSQVACFPYAQHFVSDSPGTSSNLKNRDELIAADKALDFDTIEAFSTKSFRTSIIISSVFSFVLTITLLLLWLSK